MHSKQANDEETTKKALPGCRRQKISLPVRSLGCIRGCKWTCSRYLKVHAILDTEHLAGHVSNWNQRPYIKNTVFDWNRPNEICVHVDRFIGARLYSECPMHYDVLQLLASARIRLITGRLKRRDDRRDISRWIFAACMKQTTKMKCVDAICRTTRRACLYLYLYNIGLCQARLIGRA